MSLSASIHLLVIGLFSVCWITTANSTENNNTGFGYELLLAKLDYLEYKILELQVENKEQGESILENQNRTKRDLMEQTSEILEQQKIFANHEKIMNAIFELNPRKHPSDNSKLLAMLNGNLTGVFSSAKSCVELKSKKSGHYWLTLKDHVKFQVFCEQALYGGGWIVIQNRFDGSVDFFKNWADYKNGFGNLDGEFWLGLEKVHQLTSTRTHELLIHLEDHAGVTKYAKYGKFSIDDESEQYALKILESHSGTLGDSLTHQKGMKFSTLDRDNDVYDGNCAAVYHGGWWYKDCHLSNLNGPYKIGDDPDTMNWYLFHNKHHGLKVSKMMIRET